MGTSRWTRARCTAPMRATSTQTPHQCRRDVRRAPLAVLRFEFVRHVDVPARVVDELCRDECTPGSEAPAADGRTGPVVPAFQAPNSGGSALLASRADNPGNRRSDI